MEAAALPVIKLKRWLIVRFRHGRNHSRRVTGWFLGSGQCSGMSLDRWVDLVARAPQWMGPGEPDWQDYSRDDRVAPSARPESVGAPAGKDYPRCASDASMFVKLPAAFRVRVVG